MELREREPSAVPDAGSAGAGRLDDSLVVEDDRFAPRCKALIGRIRRTGEEVIITRHGKPVARLVPIAGSPLDEEEDERLTWDLEAIEP